MPRNHFDVRLPTEDIAGCVDTAMELARQVKQDWKNVSIDKEIFTNGITNKVFCLFPAERPSDRLIFRVFGENSERIIDRAHELEQWEKLSECGFAAPLYATFTNGIICGHLAGNPVTIEMLRDPIVQKQICLATAAIHGIALEPNAQACTWEKLNKFIANIDPVYKEAEQQSRFNEAFGDVNIVELTNTLRKKVEALSPSIVFCHNDLLINNILYEAEKGTISFIDYEYADANYGLFDIGNHFNEWAGVDGADFSRCPTSEEKHEWLTRYYAARDEAVNIEDAVHQVLLFQAASHLFWSTWALVQSQNSSIPFDYLGYAIARFDEYEKKLVEYEKGQ